MEISSVIAISAAIVGMLTGASGIVISLRNDKLTRVQVMNQFYSEGDSDVIKALRKTIVSKMENEPMNPNCYDADIGKMMGFYDKWALSCLKKYLPIDVFEGNPGFQIITFYNYTKEYIFHRRKQKIGNVQNVAYAISIEKLVKKLESKYY